MKIPDTIKYYVYLRRSSEGEDRQVQSIERQSDEVQKIIQYSKLQIVEVFQESRSAMTPNNRPEFTRMIAGIKKGKANGIICWHINRLSRNPLESGIIQQLLEDGKIMKIVTKDREYIAADNSIIYSVESSLATQYSKDLGKMVRSGIEKKIAQGIAPIHAPVGYLNTKRAEHGSNYIIKDPERYKVVRKMWELMLTGRYSPASILAYIHEDIGFRTKFASITGKGTIARNSLYKILANPFYTGMFLYKGKLYQGKHEPMITLEEFDTVQKILGKHGRPIYKAHVFPYTGIIKCSDCGSRITACEKTKLIKSTGVYQTYTYYYCCKRKKGAQSCRSKPFTGKQFEEIIATELHQLDISNDFKNLALKSLRKILDTSGRQERDISKYQKEEVLKMERELKNLLSLRLKEAITDDEFREAKKEREGFLARMKKRLTEHVLGSNDLMSEFDLLLSSVTNLNQTFLRLDPQGRKGLMLQIGWNYTLNGNKLLFDKPEWLDIISQNKEALYDEFQWLELEKGIETYNQLNDLWAMCPLLRKLVNTVGTESMRPIHKPELKPMGNKIIYDDG